MSLDPELIALGKVLQQLGYVVVEHADHISVRFRMLSHVRVYRAGEQLVCEPRFGMLPRARASLISFGTLAAIAVALVATQGLSRPALTYCALAVLSAVYNVARYVSTENCITRVQMLWAMRHGVPGWAPPLLPAADPAATFDAWQAQSQQLPRR